MRIGITGATGFIGRALIRLAGASGHEVIAYTRGENMAADLKGATEVLRLPADKFGVLPETRLDALVHLSGEPILGLWTKAKMAKIRRSRIDLTKAVVANLGTWAAPNRPKAFLCGSAIGYYGERGDEVLDEKSTPGTNFLAKVCVDWEVAGDDALALGMRVVHLRTGLVLGPGGGPYPPMRRTFRLGVGGRIGSGRQWMAWIHEQDETGLILWAAENEAVRGPINLSAPNPVTNAELTRQMARSLHRPALFPVPAFALRLLPHRMADEMLLISQRAIPRAVTDLGYRFACSKLEDALAALA